jgi:O-antigen ligase
MFQDSPLVGMGYDNYGRLFWDDYQFRVPGNTKRYRSVRSPHSTYIDFLANGGTLGSAIWLGMLLVVWLNLKAARSILATDTTSQRIFLVQALTYAFFLQCLYGLSLTVHKDKLLWMIFGLSVAVRNVLKSEGEQLLSSPDGLSTQALSPAMVSTFDNLTRAEEGL